MPKTRSAKYNDAIFIAQAEVDSQRNLYSGLVAQSFLDSLSVQDSASSWETIISDNNNTTIILEELGKPIGALSCGPCRDDDLNSQVTGEIWSIYVDPSYQRKGYGTSLFEEARQALRKAGYNELSIWVLDTDLRARGFLESLGLTCDGAARFDDYYGDGIVTKVRYQGSCKKD